MKWKERLIIVAFVCVILSLVILRKKAIDDSFLSPVVVISSEENITLTKLHIPDVNINDNGDLYEKWTKMHPWDMWHDMVTKRAITHQSESFVSMIIEKMVNSKILAADIGYKGTQLKIQLTLDGPEPQLVVFKPKRYERTKVLGGTPYEGYDRHNAEIAAFQLDRILGFYRTPPAAGRVLNLKDEIIPVAKKKLLKTFFNQGNHFCFYGVCLYCKKEEPACGEGSMLEGVLILWIPLKWEISKVRHPWQRTYSKRKAKWEVDDTYCDSVTQTSPYNKGPRVLDIMDAAIFDFIIGNADRHHYEYLSREGDNGMMLLLDNGKSFGNPYKDETSILAPVYQCCQLRHSTYVKLKLFSTDSTNVSSLSHILSSRLKKDPLYPILTVNHLLAVDRRLKRILVTLDLCFDKKGKDNVLKK